MRKKPYRRSVIICVILAVCGFLLLGAALFLRSEKWVEINQRKCPHET